MKIDVRKPVGFMRFFLAFLLLSTAARGNEFASRLREISLDPEQCYRVRDLSLFREDLRMYLTDGYLIFTSPPNAAVFTADVEGGDAELLLMPPDRAERRSLASYTGSPILNEHFTAAVLVFSDDTHEALTAQFPNNPANRKAPDVGTLLAEQWNSVVRNIMSSFESRVLLDTLTGEPKKYGFFSAAVSGRKLDNFDLWYDPRAREQIVAGQLVSREDRSFFNVWTNFVSRSFRTRARAAHEPEMKLEDYRIEATVHPDLKMEVSTRVRVIPGPAAKQVLPFEFTNRMKITGASIDGLPVEVFQRDSVRSNLIRNTTTELVLLVPAQPLAAGRAYEVEMRCEGTVIYDAGNDVFYVGSRGSWYPSRGLQYATFDLNFRHPSDLDLVTPGELISSRTEGEWRITRRRTPAIRMAGFNLGKYEKARVSKSRYTVDVYGNRSIERALQPAPAPPVVLPPAGAPWNRGRTAGPRVIVIPPPPERPAPAFRIQELAGEIASALEFMASRFGPPAMPYLNVSPVPGRFGQGFPGLIYLSTLTYLHGSSKPLAELDEREQVFFSQMLHAHETAHQWWGNVVTAAGYRDDWLMEALANYSALLYLERRHGPRSVATALEEYRRQLLAKNGGDQEIDAAGPIVLGTRLESSQTPLAWRRITYGKGSWIIHMLRRRLGDEKFLSMLGALRSRFEWKEISTEDFRILAAGFLPPKSSDAKLEAFFDQWVYDTGIPELSLKHSTKGKAPNVRLTLTVTQSKVDESHLTDVPVEIHLPRGKPSVHWVKAAPEGTTVTIPLKQAPLKVVLNPNNSVLAR